MNAVDKLRAKIIEDLQKVEAQNWNDFIKYINIDRNKKHRFVGLIKFLKNK